MADEYNVDPSSTVNEHEVTCPICFKLMENPVQTAECGHLFCRACILGWAVTKRKASCPVCKTKLKIPRLRSRPVDKRAERLVLGTLVKCSLCRQDKSLPFAEWPDHVANCPEGEIPCPFLDYGCGALMKRKDVCRHLREASLFHLNLHLSKYEKYVDVPANVPASGDGQALSTATDYPSSSSKAREGDQLPGPSFEPADDPASRNRQALTSGQDCPCSSSARDQLPGSSTSTFSNFATGRKRSADIDLDSLAPRPKQSPFDFDNTALLTFKNVFHSGQK